MFVRKLLQLGIATAGLAVGASPAAAAGFITGSLSITGFFGTAFVPGTSIVSQLTEVVPSVAVAGGGFGDYAGSGGIVVGRTIVLDVLDPGYPGLQPTYAFADGTEFRAASVESVLREGLTCSSSFCSDSLMFALYGVATRPGFDNTAAVLKWTGQGSCTGRDGFVPRCTRPPSASWSASLSSPVGITEPAALGLLGLGLLGLLARRRIRPSVR